MTFRNKYLWIVPSVIVPLVVFFVSFFILTGSVYGSQMPVRLVDYFDVDVNSWLSKYNLFVLITSLICVIWSAAAIIITIKSERFRNGFFWWLWGIVGLVVSFAPSFIIYLIYPLSAGYQQPYFILFAMSIVEFCLTYVLATRFAPREFRLAFFPFIRSSRKDKVKKGAGK